MKKLLVLMLMLFLCGCGAQESFETVSDEMVLPVLAQPREILLTLPEETLLPAMESDGRTLYLCNGYDVAVQTFSSGDLDGTIREISGFGKDELTIMETTSGDCRCTQPFRKGESGADLRHSRILQRKNRRKDQRAFRTICAGFCFAQKNQQVIRWLAAPGQHCHGIDQRAGDFVSG